MLTLESAFRWSQLTAEIVGHLLEFHVLKQLIDGKEIHILAEPFFLRC